MNDGDAALKPIGNERDKPKTEPRRFSMPSKRMSPRETRELRRIDDDGEDEENDAADRWGDWGLRVSSPGNAGDAVADDSDDADDGGDDADRCLYARDGDVDGDDSDDRRCEPSSTTLPKSELRRANEKAEFDGDCIGNSIEGEENDADTPGATDVGAAGSSGCGELLSECDEGRCAMSGGGDASGYTDEPLLEYAIIAGISGAGEEDGDEALGAAEKSTGTDGNDGDDGADATVAIVTPLSSVLDRENDTARDGRAGDAKTEGKAAVSAEVAVDVGCGTAVARNGAEDDSAWP